MEVISMSWTILTLLISSIITRGLKVGDRVYLLGNLTGQTPKKRRMTQSSHLKELNAACSFPIETEQHDDDENGVDNETIVQKPLTSSQKKVSQNIHTNCGHPTKEEFLRLFVSLVPDENSSVQHVQQKGILQNPDFQQRCRGLFASTKRLVWTFLRLFSSPACVRDWTPSSCGLDQ